MKEFFRDYVDLNKESVRFMKNHWKGMSIVYLATFGAAYGYLYIKNKKIERELGREIAAMNFNKDQSEEEA